MVGIKGRSGGKATTAEDKAKKVAAAHARHHPEGLPDPPPPADPESDDPVKRLGKPLTWGDELKRQQVEGERTQNRRRAIEVERAEVELQRARDEADEARGRLVPRAEMDKAVSMVRDAWWTSARQIPSDILAALPGLPVEARELIKKAADEAVSKAAERVKTALA